MRFVTKKELARLAVRRAIKEGSLVKEPCLECGTTYEVEAHHEDYNKPLEVIWYCRKHHVHRHIERGDMPQLRLV